jgi:hypothetical protein
MLRRLAFAGLADVEHAHGIGREFFPARHHVQQPVAINPDFHACFLASSVPRRSAFSGVCKATLPAQRSENGLPLRA